MKARRWLRRLRLAAEAALLIVALLLTLLWASLPDVAPLARKNPATTAFIELRRAEAAAAGRPFRLQWQWRSTDQISQYLRATAVLAEDARFYEHQGVDWRALEKAAEANVSRGALSIGGSTITQQLAKNLFLSPSRSLVRKLRELLIAGRLEDALGKERILELYLNVVEWGDGVFGAEAAARHWFGRSARQLSPAQAARLASALPNPFKRSPKVRTQALQRKVARLLWQLRQSGLINRAQLTAAAAEAGLPPPPDPRPGEQLPAELSEALDEPAEEDDVRVEPPAGDSATPAAPDAPEAPRPPQEGQEGPAAEPPAAEPAPPVDDAPVTLPEQAPSDAPAGAPAAPTPAP